MHKRILFMHFQNFAKNYQGSKELTFFSCKVRYQFLLDFCLVRIYQKKLFFPVFFFNYVLFFCKDLLLFDKKIIVFFVFFLIRIFFSYLPHTFYFLLDKSMPFQRGYNFGILHKIKKVDSYRLRHVTESKTTVNLYQKKT